MESSSIQSTAAAPFAAAPKRGVDNAPPAKSPAGEPASRVDHTPRPAATDVQTHFDAMTKTLVASIVDKETGSVVAEVPPEALRILAQRTAEFRGKIFDTKA